MSDTARERHDLFRPYAKALHRDGVAVVPVLNDATKTKWANRIWSAMDEFPEYLHKGRRTQRVLGGFGALANPSSFHHPTVQALRNRLKDRFSMPLFRTYAAITGRQQSNLEMLFDRLCVRCHEFGSVGKEAWHRDIYDGAKYGLRTLPPSDEIFGGWINLSDEDQYLVGIIGSHMTDDAFDAQARGGGFAQLTASQIREQRVDARLADQADRSANGGRASTDSRGYVRVPPGSMVIFFQRLLHSVAGGKQPPDPQLRLFLGHRLTDDDAPMFPLDHVIDTGAVPRIPSGQNPPMYSNNHYAFFSKQTRYREWGENTFKRRCLFQRHTPSGTSYFTPGSARDLDPHANRNRYMPTMAAMGCTPYAYSTASKRTLSPETLDDYGWSAETDVVRDE